MKHFTLNTTALILVAGLVTGCDEPIELNDPPPTPAKSSFANFIPFHERINEISPEGKDLSIQLSNALDSAGSIEVTVQSSTAIYNTHFVTNPAMVNNKITLIPAIGESIAIITIIPIDNSNVTGELELSLTISNTSGSIKKGTVLNQMARISDDELTNKPKGYEITAGLWGLKKIYEYDEAGRVKRVHIENASPAKSTRTETYFYDTSGKIEKINTYPGIDMVFTWANGRITKSETIEHGSLTQYTNFDYDDAGNVSGTANYYRQPDGHYKLGSLMAYLYFTDGNLYKSLYYIPSEGAEEYTLLSTRTYEGYLNAENPFPMVDILPTVKAQQKLPSSFRMEEHGLDLHYSFSYQFNDGLVTKRTTTGPQSSETANYFYYE